VYHKQLLELYQEKKAVFLSASFLGAVYVLAYKLFMSRIDIYNAVINNIPNILLKILGESNSLIINSAAIFIVATIAGKGYVNKLLLFLGEYSYEIFLFHGVFLIKYDPFIRNSGVAALVAGFLLLLLFTSSLSYAITKVYR
jgi:peptidoglycan/LPS O-acetylase OafA/YrhL